MKIDLTADTSKASLALSLGKLNTFEEEKSEKLINDNNGTLASRYQKRISDFLSTSLPKGLDVSNINAEETDQLRITISFEIHTAYSMPEFATSNLVNLICGAVSGLDFHSVEHTKPLKSDQAVPAVYSDDDKPSTLRKFKTSNFIPSF